MDSAAFKKWLERQSYADTTVQLTLREVDYALYLLSEGDDIPARLHHSIKRFFGYAATTGQDQNDAFVLQSAINAQQTPPEMKGLHGGRKKQIKRREQVSIPSDEWRVLAQAVEADISDEARVLEIMLAHGLRISDVLRVTEHNVQKATVSDVISIEVKGSKKILLSTRSAQDAWRNVHKRMKASPRRPDGGWANVAEWICPATGGSLLTVGAQRRIERKLKALAAEAGVSGRIHLHRLRRTIAVQALAATKDLTQVQQLLNHSNIATTSRYVDEAKTEAVGELQETIRRTFRGT